MGGYGGRFAQWVRSDNPLPYNSFGNGSAMRVSPVAWAAHDLEFKYYPNFTQEYVKELVESCAKYAGYDINIKKEDVINRFDETCQGTVPVALWIIGNSTSFEDAVRKAVSLGADADTLGAIVGSIAEAIWGIPKEMQLEIMNYLPSDMKRIVLQFCRRYIKDSFLVAGYGDEGAAIDMMPED